MKNVLFHEFSLTQLGIPFWLAKRVRAHIQMDQVQIKKISTVENVTKDAKASKNNIFSKIRCLVVENKANRAHCFMSDKKQHVLLVKMLLAINLDEKNTQCIALEEVELMQMLKQVENEIKTILLMADDMYIKNDKIFVCPHPADIIIDNTLRPRAWEVLKRLKEYLVRE